MHKVLCKNQSSCVQNNKYFNYNELGKAYDLRYFKKKSRVLLCGDKILLKDSLSPKGYLRRYSLNNCGFDNLNVMCKICKNYLFFTHDKIWTKYLHTQYLQKVICVDIL